MCIVEFVRVCGVCVFVNERAGAPERVRKGFRSQGFGFASRCFLCAIMCRSCMRRHTHNMTLFVVGICFTLKA